MKIIKYFFLIEAIIVFSFGETNAQNENVIRLSVDANFDIRLIAKEYFGNADLWPYIVKYNNYKSLSEIKPGTSLLIPRQKVNDLFEKKELANKSIQDAALIGAKILAEELLKNAENSLKEAIKQISEFEYDSALKFINDAISFSQKAYRQTKEIREKTIDAIISFKKGTVQKMFPSVLKWENAEIYENLKENDWARTLSLSMANITFQDLSQLKLNANSQAVIQSSRLDQLNNKTFTKVKLEKGDAYAMLFNTPKKKFDMEIKGIKTKINSKYFWAEKTNINSKIANYNGEIKIEAQDSAVVVAKNQGSVIPDGGLPSKPKNLLPPPKILNPFPLQIFKSTSVTFEWREIKEAKSYWLEIATDRNFKKTFKDQKNIKGFTIKVEGFKGGVYYWRVCSVDNLDLPGSYSESNAFIVSIDNNEPYLAVEFPVHNYVTKENKLVIKGKTNPECSVTVNQKNLTTENDGNFKGEISLKEGSNPIEIQSVNTAGFKNSILRKVYCETGADFPIIEKKFGEMKDKAYLTTNENYLKLNLTTRAFSKIEIDADANERKRIGYADSLGISDITLELPSESEKFMMTIFTPAGYMKKVNLIVKKDLFPPVITLEEPKQNLSNTENILLTGSVNEKSAVSINGDNIITDAQNKFSKMISLKKGENSLEIKALDAAGNSNVLMKNIFYDNEPPTLIANEIVQVDRQSNLYKILVRAADATALKKTAEVEVQSNNETNKEYLELNNQEKIYEGIFNFSSKTKPVIKKITLEDYLSNRKSYQIN